MGGGNLGLGLGWLRGCGFMDLWFCGFFWVGLECFIGDGDGDGDGDGEVLGWAMWWVGVGGSGLVAEVRWGADVDIFLRSLDGWQFGFFPFFFLFFFLFSTITYSSRCGRFC